MAWIKTIPLDQAEGPLLEFILEQRKLYPAEYAMPVDVPNPGPSIVESHSIIPNALFHAFATFGSLMSPDLPLRRDQHEMIATVVSGINRCVY
ncbi:MAG: hypothetical protein HUU60_09405 [Armatimonadetes bacterium]|nr:hypothetical protein [Armatimonadota bacterium]